ncbi:single-stranded-DNA-specific exonuclease RecJ [Thermaurantimonas aggregans]|uniref:Single-stranded-DNA-specific exonuclease RecJ n=1 Tax=Thermaurantimonas aggregans TaxID=2173829 RepID=A0A401XJA2_9FLAO|nr:single-stranded-DNA-specific exonuclease RecJ [Thermaurantimonas aggregans]MCX8147837.1 single-stranded-DNA-specific exonuclease RecJ [Thermaurantimonas aggregans]GCD77083.1 single-stranded-DNA-specific exonuclease RecJ [Thermaurantimonas aggregans]
MSIQNALWVIRNQEITEEIHQLSRALNFEPEYTALLFSRGVTSFEQARRFFKPSYEDLYDPFLFRDMDNAVEHLALAVQRGEKIMFYGDYDVDGTTSVALMSRFFRSFYTNFITYIPDRYTEGYGLTLSGIQHAKSSGVHTIVTLDCGIKSVELADEIRKLGMHLIVIDHHTPGHVLPTAVAVVDAKRPDCPYPYKELSACAVAFKFACALADRFGIDKGQLYQLLDLVAVSIGADMVPLTDENRILMKIGLKVLNSKPTLGLAALINSSGITGPITSYHVGFILGPRINAAGRIDHANIALELLTTDDPKKATEIADQIENLNAERKSIQDLTANEAISMVKANPERYEYAIALYGKDWLKGVLGIVAARLVEEFYRPAIVFTESQGKLVGSARSIPTVDIYNVLERCEHHIYQYGGHRQAAGVTVLPEKFEEFFSEFKHQVNNFSTLEDRQRKLVAEAVIRLAQIDEKFTRLSTQHIQPTGYGNPSPLYVSRKLKVLDSSCLMGADQSHIRLHLHEETTSTTMEAVWFSKGHFFEQIRSASAVDVMYRVDFNDFRNERRIQLKVEDIALHP